MALITAHVEDITGEPDNGVWTFTTTLREGSEPGTIVGPRICTTRPVAGDLSVDLVPGEVIVTYGTESWTITVPDAAADLWDLIAESEGS